MRFISVQWPLISTIQKTPAQIKGMEEEESELPWAFSLRNVKWFQVNFNYFEFTVKRELERALNRVACAWSCFDFWKVVRTFSQMKSNYFQEEGYQRRTYIHTTVLMEYRSLMLQRSITLKTFCNGSLFILNRGHKSQWNTCLQINLAIY